MAALAFLLFSAFAMISVTPPSNAFTTRTSRQQPNGNVILHGHDPSPDAPSLADISQKVDGSYTSLRDEAEILRAKAELLRREIEQGERDRSPDTRKRIAASTKTTANAVTATNVSPWSLIESDDNNDEAVQEFRLYVDVGREQGTWMDPRWGASGNRITFSLDVRLLSEKLADASVANKMVKDNSMGKCSHVYVLETAPFARLRDGFDRMACYGGTYRIDRDNGGRHTIRMLVEVEGTKADQNYIYGDVSIPKGPLFFSLPCFGGRIDQLSTKEGPVTVRQSGWHTGWRRKESRILGIFQAKKLAEAKQKDKF
jgi:hypothetical protein